VAVISIIVPACGQVALTRRCVASIRTHTEEPFELILVSNGSTAAEADELHGLYDGFGEFVHFAEQMGYPRAINEGVRRATGEYLCLLNNDAAFTGPWVKRLTAALDHGEVVSPIIDNISQPCQRLGHLGAPGRLAGVGMLFFVCVVMRRATFEAVGGLDERFGLGNGEDVVFCEDVKTRNGRLLVEPAVFVTHRGSTTFLATLGAEGYQRLLKMNHELRIASGLRSLAMTGGDDGE